MTAAEGTRKPSLGERWARAAAVFLDPRVLIILLLGFSSGLPLALSGSTLLLWMKDVGVDLGTIGLFSLVGVPYTIKFLWAPIVDAFQVPILGPMLGHRRGWLVFSQILLMAAIVLLGFSEPARLAVDGGARRGDRRHRLCHAGHRHRRLPRRISADREPGRRHGLFRRRLSHRHAGVDGWRRGARRLFRAYRRRPESECGPTAMPSWRRSS